MQFVAYDALDSTNAQARRLLDDGAISLPACVVTREQTDGRGTHGRTWHSPRDAGVYLSVIDRPAAGASIAPDLYTLAAGVACAEAIEAVLGVRIELRPVNDLWCAGRKLGGILVEAASEAGALTSIVIGVGINVRDVPRRVTAGAAAPVSLEEVVPPSDFATLREDRLTRTIADRVVAWTEKAARGERDCVSRAWTARCVAGAEVPRVV